VVPLTEDIPLLYPLAAPFSFSSSVLVELRALVRIMGGRSPEFFSNVTLIVTPSESQATLPPSNATVTSTMVSIASSADVMVPAFAL
jgi:hypothetical protein